MSGTYNIEAWREDFTYIHTTRLPREKAGGKTFICNKGHHTHNSWGIATSVIHNMSGGHFYHTL